MQFVERGSVKGLAPFGPEFGAMAMDVSAKALESLGQASKRLTVAAQAGVEQQSLPTELKGSGAARDRTK